jgi:mannose-6-phosphate isomerase
MFKEDRPWGHYENLLDTDYCKVKRIVVKPNQRPSYQYHHKRSEHWIVVQGTALVTIDGNEKVHEVGEYIYIPTGAKHRIQNKGEDELIFIEVQCGTYFGEDDIVRISDDYNR